jgi:hypothetical protein
MLRHYNMNDNDMMDEIERDERLREAAPDMLAALKTILNTCETTSPHVDDWRHEPKLSTVFWSIEELCRAAIAKAGGKS